MAYGDSSLAKTRLRIIGSAQDTYLGQLITEADAYIDSILQSYTIVPLSVVPQIIKEISTDLACGYYRENETGQPSTFTTRGQLMLERYIREKYFPELYEGKRSEIDTGE